MNYSVELWDNYNKAKDTLYLHLSQLSNIITLYSTHYDSQLNLSYTLKNVSSLKIIQPDLESFTKGFNSFINDFINQYNYLSEFLVCLKDEILNPLIKLHETSLKKLNFNLIEISSSEKNYNDSVKKLENAKNQFHTFAKEIEESMFKSLTLKKSGKNGRKIKNEEIKGLTFLQKAKENEKLYVDLIEKTNKLQDEYIEKKKFNLNEIQDMEMEIGENIKDSFRRFIIIKVAYLRNMQYDMQNKSKMVEDINITNDINNFINNNKTYAVPPQKFEYVPYISKIDMSSNKDNMDVINEVKLFINSNFGCEVPKEINPHSDTNKNKELYNAIKNYVNNIFDKEKPIEKNISNEIKNILLNKRSRRIFLREMNNYIIENKNLNSSTLNDTSFDKVLMVLKEALNILQVETDFDSMKIILNLSNRVYKMTTEENVQKKIFIENELNFRTQKIFNTFDFWKELIKYDIVEEMHNQKQFNLYSCNDDQNSDKQKNRIQKIVLNKLNTYLFYMREFHYQSNMIKQIINDFKEIYDLNEQDLLKFRQLIKEINNEEKNLNISKNEVEKKLASDDNQEKNKSNEIKEDTNSEINTNSINNEDDKNKSVEGSQNKDNIKNESNNDNNINNDDSKDSKEI